MENYMNCTNFIENSGYWAVRFELHRIYEYIFILIGIIGNSIVVYIHASKFESGRRNTTSTNHLIICLAIADILTALFYIPPRLVNIPSNAAGRFYCHIFGSRYLLWVSFRASVYTLTTIAIERYLAVVHPFTYKAWAKKNVVKYAILVIWLFPLIIRFPRIYFRVVDDCGRCVTRYPSGSQSAPVVYDIFLFLAEYLCPMIIMTYTSIRIILVLKRDPFDQDVRDNRSARQQSMQLRSMRRRFTIMFIFVCGSFMLLWTPDQLGIFLFRIRVFPRAYTHSVAFDVFVTIAYLNAAITNPIIYSVCLPPFRRAVKSLIMCRGVDKSQTPILMDMTTSSMASSSA